MTSIASKTSKIVAALVAAATLSVAVAPAAEAKGWHHHGHGYGYGAAALGGGLLLGALIASSRPTYAADVRDCWIEKRKRYDAYGYPYYTKIRVCD